MGARRKNAFGEPSGFRKGSSVQWLVHGLHAMKSPELAGRYDTKAEAMKAARRAAKEEGEAVTISGPKGQMLQVNPAKLDRCVKEVARRGGARSPYAVCKAALKNPASYRGMSSQKLEQIKAVMGPHVYANDFLERDRARREMEKIEHALKLAYKRERQKNPAAAAAEAFKDFHGYDSKEVVTIKKRIHYHKHLAAAGEFEGFLVKPISGAKPGAVHIPGAILAFNEKRNQLFIEGGNQSLTNDELKKFGVTTVHEHEVLGTILKVGYLTDKKHLGKHGGEAIYDHTFRATNRAGRHVIVKIARAPFLTYDVPNQQFGISGGSYDIKPEGIDL